MTWDKNRWPNFTQKEMSCKHCGAHILDDAFMDKLQRLRIDYGKPMVVTSAYRCSQHNAAVSSTGKHGPHTTGKAVDIAVSRKDAYDLVHLAMLHGFSGIGVNQKGSSRFIHLDTITGKNIRPTIWSY